MRGNVAAILDVPESMIKVVPMEIGGGFGGKGTGYLEPVAAVLSRKTGHPIKMVMSRKEVFEGTGPSSGTFIRCKIGAKNDGTFTAAQLYMVYEAGAYPGSPMAGGVYLRPEHVQAGARAGRRLRRGLQQTQGRPPTARPVIRRPASP